MMSTLSALSSYLISASCVPSFNGYFERDNLNPNRFRKNRNHKMNRKSNRLHTSRKARAKHKR